MVVRNRQRGASYEHSNLSDYLWRYFRNRGGSSLTSRCQWLGVGAGAVVGASLGVVFWRSRSGYSLRLGDSAGKATPLRMGHGSGMISRPFRQGFLLRSSGLRQTRRPGMGYGGQAGARFRQALIKTQIFQ